MGFISTFLGTVNTLANIANIGNGFLKEHKNHGCSVLIFHYNNQPFEWLSLIRPIIINRTNDPIFITGFHEVNSSWTKYNCVIEPHTMEVLTTQLEYNFNVTTRVEIASNIGILHSIGM